MNEFLELLVNPRWIQWIGVLFLIRTLYRAHFKFWLVWILEKTHLAHSYLLNYQRRREEELSPLKQNDKQRTILVLSATWARSKFILSLMGAFLVYLIIQGYSVAQPNVRIFVNCVEMVLVIGALEYYAKSVTLKRDIEASV